MSSHKTCSEKLKIQIVRSITCYHLLNCRGVFSMANFYLLVDFYAVLGDFCPIIGLSKSVKFCGVGSPFGEM